MAEWRGWAPWDIKRHLTRSELERWVEEARRRGPPLAIMVVKKK